MCAFLIGLFKINDSSLYERPGQHVCASGNSLEVKDSSIYINGELAIIYTFKMDYYYKMGDNRHKSADSRFWDFVPEDHIVGRAVFIWLSLDQDNRFLSKIRRNRIFTRIK